MYFAKHQSVDLQEGARLGGRRRRRCGLGVWAGRVRRRRHDASWLTVDGQRIDVVYHSPFVVVVAANGRRRRRPQHDEQQQLVDAQTERHARLSARRQVPASATTHVVIQLNVNRKSLLFSRWLQLRVETHSCIGYNCDATAIRLPRDFRTYCLRSGCRARLCDSLVLISNCKKR